MVLYLDVLAAAAVLWRRPASASGTQHRFAILVPAHNEEGTLPRLLQSVNSLDYPDELYDTYVVADNCTDGTASVARRYGADARERHDPELRGKGHALRWLLAQVPAHDAVIIVDADSTLSPNFLHVMNRHLTEGHPVVQAYYGVLNAAESWTSAIRFAAMVLFNDLRPRGRAALGLSAGLHGNGMCFAAWVLERFGWESFALAEDVEFHLKLVEAGLRVAYAPDAVVLAEMPVSLRQAETQNVRWERGRLQMLRAFAPSLVMRGLRTRNLTMIEALAEQVVPPLSVLTAVSVLFVPLTLLGRWRLPRALAILVLVGQLAYILTGLRLARAPRSIYLALLRAPLYILWKVWIYTMAAVHLRDNRWVRTTRQTE